MSIILAVTGNIACGKSEAGKIFTKLGIPVIDSDDIVHQLYAQDLKIQAELMQEFGSLDRTVISKIVFADPEKRKKLESIIHPAVNREFLSWVNQNQDAPLLVNLVPLVFEAKLEKRYHQILVISCPENLQLSRLKKRRPDLDDSSAREIINSQMSQADKIKRADHHIINKADIAELERHIKALVQNLLSN